MKIQFKKDLMRWKFTFGKRTTNSPKSKEQNLKRKEKSVPYMLTIHGITARGGKVIKRNLWEKWLHQTAEDYSQFLLQAWHQSQQVLCCLQQSQSVIYKFSENWDDEQLLPQEISRKNGYPWWLQANIVDLVLCLLEEWVKDQYNKNY